MNKVTVTIEADSKRVMDIQGCMLDLQESLEDAGFKQSFSSVQKTPGGGRELKVVFTCKEQAHE